MGGVAEKESTVHGLHPKGVMNCGGEERKRRVPAGFRKMAGGHGDEAAKSVTEGLWSLFLIGLHWQQRSQDCEWGEKVPIRRAIGEQP